LKSAITGTQSATKMRNSNILSNRFCGSRIVLFTIGPAYQYLVLSLRDLAVVTYAHYAALALSYMSPLEIEARFRAACFAGVDSISKKIGDSVQ